MKFMPADIGQCSAYGGGVDIMAGKSRCFCGGALDKCYYLLYKYLYEYRELLRMNLMIGSLWSNRIGGFYDSLHT